VTGQRLGIAGGQVLLHLLGRFAFLGIGCRRRRRIFGFGQFKELQIDDGQRARLNHILLLQHLQGDDLVEAQFGQLLDAALRLLNAGRERTKATAWGGREKEIRFTSYILKIVPLILDFYQDLNINVVANLHAQLSLHFWYSIGLPFKTWFQCSSGNLGPVQTC